MHAQSSGGAGNGETGLTDLERQIALKIKKLSMSRPWIAMITQQSPRDPGTEDEGSMFILP